MSSIMRRRSGLTGYWLIEISCLKWGLKPLDLQTGLAAPDSFDVITSATARAITASAV